MKRYATWTLALILASITGYGPWGVLDVDAWDDSPPVYFNEDPVLLSRVRKFLEEEEAGRYGQAIDIYREVASYISTQPSDRPHLYQAESGLYLPVEVYLRGRVISFPAEEIASFRREADLQAKPQWEEILRRGDVSRLRGFIRKNPLSSYISRGVESLAAYHLERGEFDEVLGALAFLQRPEDWSPESRLLQRIALRSTGRTDPGGESDETPLALGGDQRSSKEILADLVEAVPLTGWRAFGGDSSHSLAPEIAFDPGRRIASGVFKEPKAAKALLDRTGERSSSAGAPPFIPYFPIHDGRRLLFSDTFDAYCLDLRDGSLLWSHSLRKDRSVPWESAAGGHYPVAGRQAVYVTLSPREAAEVSMEEAEDAETRDFTPGEGYRVMALEISTGETLWDTSKRNDLGEEFTNAAFVSSPLLLGDRLYLLVTRLEKEASVSIISLNAVTGDKIWETHLCTAFSPLILGRGLRGAYLAGGKSRIYACTNLGAVGCLDAATGEVVWIRAYDRYPAATLDDFLEAGREPPAEAPILTDTALLAAPSDSPYLYSLDRDNGRVLWRFERGKEEALIGVRGETAILAGDGVLALQVETGRVAWRVDALAGALAGRPAIGGDLLYVPTTKGLFLHQASDGTAAGHYVWSNPDEEAGNILFAGRRMLTISRLRVNIYEDRADTLRKLSALPPFPARHGESELLLRRGNARQAIRVLEGTVALARDEAERDAVRQSLARAHLTLGEKAVGRGDLPAAVASFEESARNRQPADRAALLLRIGKIHETVETPNKALPAYRKILLESFELFASTGSLPSHAAIVASARIRRLVEKHGRGIYEPFERQAGRELAMAKKLGNLSGYQKVVAAYPNSAAAREASLAIAEIYEGLDQYSLGASHLAELIRRHPDVAPDIYRKLASLYERSGRPGRARKTLLSLAEGGETGLEIAEAIERLEAIGGDLPDVSPASKLLWRSTTSLSPTRLQILVPESPRMADLFVVSSSGAIEVHDVRTGLLRWRRMGLSGRRRNRIVVQGNRILLPDPDLAGIIAIDLLTGDEIWRSRLPGEDGERPPELLRKIAADDRLVAATAIGGEVFLFALKDGELIRAEAVPNLDPDKTPVMHGGRAIVTLRPAGVARIDPDPAPPLRFERPGRGPSLAGLPVVDPDGRLIILLGSKRIISLNMDDFSVAWEAEFESTSHILLPPGGGTVIVFPHRQGDRIIRALDSATGVERWSEPLEKRSRAGPVAIDSEAVYLTHRGDGGTCRALSIADGRLLWERKGVGVPRELHVTRGYLLSVDHDRSPPRLIFLNRAQAGEGEETITVPMDRYSVVAVSDEMILVAGSTGLFGYGPLDAEAVRSELAAQEESGAALNTIAATRFALGQRREAIELLAQAALAEDLTAGQRQGLFDQMAGYRAALAEEEPEEAMIPRLYQPPDIDGELRDWYSDAARVDLNSPANISKILGSGPGGVPWEGREDLSGTLYMGWDNKNFYFLIDVNDTVLRPYEGGDEVKEWKGDCLLIAIDTRNDQGYKPRGDDFLVTLALRAPGDDDEDEEERERNKPKGKYFVKRKDDNSGLVYEAAIPWEVFRDYGVANLDPEKGPEPGFRFGFNPVLTDDDGNGRARKTLSWTPGIRIKGLRGQLYDPGEIVPKYYGKVILK